ncbi:MAG: 30S ribosomal protein S17 [Acidimicrobiia bacterium]
MADTKTNEETKSRASRKVREGIVTSDAMDKTVVVTITYRKPHPQYRKLILQSKKLYVHDEKNEAGVGDKVRVAETRPLSATKRWRLVEIIEKAK